MNRHTTVPHLFLLEVIVIHFDAEYNTGADGCNGVREPKGDIVNQYALNYKK